MKVKMMFLCLGVIALGAPIPANADMLKNSKEKLSYAFGMQVGDSLRGGKMKMDIKHFLTGVEDELQGRKTLLSEDKAARYRNRFFKHRRKILADKNLALARNFLAENRKKKDVTATSDGLQYTLLRKGYGAHPRSSDLVRIQYRGRVMDGTEFYNSYKRGRSVVLPVDRVISGLGEALKLMSLGSRYRFFVPPKLAYGERGSGKKIEPNALLIYDIEMLAIEAPMFRR